MIDPIPKELLERGRRATARRVAAALINLMADSDADFAHIGQRIDRSEQAVRGWLHDMIEGNAGTVGLDEISDFCLAMAAEPDFTIRPCSFLVSADGEYGRAKSEEPK